MVSETFNTLAGFNKAYNKLRLEVMESLSIDGKARLNGALILLQKFEGSEDFVPATSTKVDMVERVKMYSGKGSTFKLSARKSLMITNR